jgi:glycerate kinase
LNGVTLSSRLLMRIVIAPDKFKDCLTAPQVADAIARGIRAARPDAQLDLCPMADGGEGTVDALVAATRGRIEHRRVTGPLPEMKVDAKFGVLGDRTTAVVEMAAASGLALLKPFDRNPLNTTTFGTGELLVAAATTPGITLIILGIGGSATVDGGIGCAQACGLPVILDGGEPVAMTEPLCGRDLPSIVLVKHGRGSPVERMKITVACDVTNPLYGPNGAAPVFGPQKGATPGVVRELDGALRALAQRLGKQAEANTPGAGAAGGLGFAMLAFFGATLRSGIDIVSDAVALRRRLEGADLCITGEGRLDASSLSGKTVGGVAGLCRSMGVPCVALVGSFGAGFEQVLDELDLDAEAITPAGMSLEDAIARAPDLLGEAAAKAVSKMVL